MPNMALFQEHVKIKYVSMCSKCEFIRLETSTSALFKYQKKCDLYYVQAKHNDKLKQNIDMR